MAGIGKYTKGVEFTLKSGNNPPFSKMGSSAYKHDPQNPVPPKMETLKPKSTITTSQSATAGKNK